MVQVTNPLKGAPLGASRSEQNTQAPQGRVQHAALRGMSFASGEALLSPNSPVQADVGDLPGSGATGVPTGRATSQAVQMEKGKGKGKDKDDGSGAVTTVAKPIVHVPAKLRGILPAKDEQTFDGLLGNMSESHRGEIFTHLEGQPGGAVKGALEQIFRGESTWQQLESEGDDVFRKLMMYLTNSSAHKGRATYDKKGQIESIQHPIHTNSLEHLFDPDWKAMEDWDQRQLRDPSRSQNLYGTTSDKLSADGPAPTGTGHDEALAYVHARAHKGVMRAEYGAESLHAVQRDLSGTVLTLTQLLDQLSAQDFTLVRLGEEASKKDHKKDKAAKKLKTWRWNNLAELKGEASAAELLQAAMLRLRARRTALQTELDELDKVLAARKTRDTIPQKDERDTARRAGKALSNLPKEHSALEKFDRHEVGAESIGATVGVAGGQAISPTLSATGGVSVGGSLDRNTQDDRRYRETKKVAVGASLGLGHKKRGGPGEDPVDVAATGVSGSYSHGETKVYKDTVHKAARAATSSMVPGQTKKNRDAMKEFQLWMKGTNASPIAQQPAAPIMTELNEAVDVVNELAQLTPGHVATNTVSGSVSLGEAVTGAEASASVSRSHHNFTKGKATPTTNDKQKRKAATTSGSFAVSIGGFTVSATLTHIANHSNPDNDGLYLALDFSVGRAISFPIGDPGALIDTVGACVGDKLSGAKMGAMTKDGKPSDGWKQWLTPAKMALEAGINMGLNQAVGALPEVVGIASPVSITFSKGKSFTLNFVRSTGAWALQYTRISSNLSVGAGAEVQAGPTPVTVSASVGYDKSMMKGEKLGDQTLTYAQTVYNGYKNQNTDKVKRGDEKWAKFTTDHDDEMGKMLKNIAKDSPKSKIRKELEGVQADLVDKQQHLQADLATLKVAAANAPFDKLNGELTATLAALATVLTGTPTQSQLDGYMESSRIMNATIQGMSPAVNQARKDAGKKTADPVIEAFAKTFFGGTGKHHGWVNA